MDKRYPTIAVLMGDRNKENAHELITGFYSCAKKEKVNLVFLIRSSIPRNTNHILSDMTGEDFQVRFSSIYDYTPVFKPDVLILAYGSLSSFSDTPDKEKLLEYYKDIPCIILKDISQKEDISYLNADNYAGMRECIEHLVRDHGYKKVAYVAGTKNNRDSQERLRAYYDVMKEYGREVSKDMVVYGDFSEYVDSQVRYLLDMHPDLEAIAFANDNMAKAGYRVCEERGLKVGKDIAITGFDDLDVAKTINPPLTSVMYSSFMLSYQAIKQAIKIYNKESVSNEKVETVLHKRASCGCSYGYEDIKFEHIEDYGFAQYIYNRLDLMVEELFSYIPYEEVKQYYREALIHFFEDFLGNMLYGNLEEYTFETQFIYLKKLCENAPISPTILLDHIVSLFRIMESCVKEESTRLYIAKIMSSTQKYIHTAEIAALKAKSEKSRHQNWFVNTFVQDLLIPEMSMEKGLSHIMKRFYSMDIGKCYFFFLEKPVKGEQSFWLSMSSKLYLAAFYESRDFVSLPREEWIPFDEEKGVSGIIAKDRGHIFTTYVLFSADEQYGFMVCENNHEDMPFVTECSLQVGSFLRFCHLNASEQESKKELEASIKLIKEQNIILNSISKIDNLTNLLNRRGFMEEALRCINENAGKAAYILFADLDHLKEINDTFGHQAGDFAIITAAGYLRECMPKEAITARIGGDEYVSLLIFDEENGANRIKQKMKEYSTVFNENCDKPYYIELSVGIHKCICDASIDITDLLQKSDELLYEEKKLRRTSIRK